MLQKNNQIKKVKHDKKLRRRMRFSLEYLESPYFVIEISIIVLLLSSIIESVKVWIFKVGIISSIGNIDMSFTKNLSCILIVFIVFGIIIINKEWGLKGSLSMYSNFKDENFKVVEKENLDNTESGETADIKRINITQKKIIAVLFVLVLVEAFIFIQSDYGNLKFADYLGCVSEFLGAVIGMLILRTFLLRTIKRAIKIHEENAEIKKE